MLPGADLARDIIVPHLRSPEFGRVALGYQREVGSAIANEHVGDFGVVGKQRYEQRRALLVAQGVGIGPVLQQRNREFLVAALGPDM